MASEDTSIVDSKMGKEENQEFKMSEDVDDQDVDVDVDADMDTDEEHMDLEDFDEIHDDLDVDDVDNLDDVDDMNNLDDIPDDEDSEDSDDNKEEAPQVPQAKGAFIVRDDDDDDNLTPSGNPKRRVIATGATADPVKDYLKQIGRVSLLNAEQEVDLSERIEAGLYAQHLLDTQIDQMEFKRKRELKWAAADGKKAKDHLLEANLRLVVSLAKR